MRVNAPLVVHDEFDAQYGLHAAPLQATVPGHVESPVQQSVLDADVALTLPVHARR